jgi:hypothetical protein
MPWGAAIGTAIGGGKGVSKFGTKRLREAHPDIVSGERAGARTSFTKGMKGSPSQEEALAMAKDFAGGKGGQLETAGQRAAEPVAEQLLEAGRSRADRLKAQHDHRVSQYMSGPGSKREPLDDVVDDAMQFIEKRLSTGKDTSQGLVPGMRKQLESFSTARGISPNDIETARQRGAIVMDAGKYESVFGKPAPVAGRRGNPAPYVAIDPVKMDAMEIQQALTDLSTVMKDPTSASGKPFYEVVDRGLRSVRDRYPHVEGVTPTGISAADGTELSGFSALQNDFSQKLGEVEGAVSASGANAPKVREAVVMRGARRPQDLDRNRALEDLAGYTDEADGVAPSAEPAAPSARSHRANERGAVLIEGPGVGGPAPVPDQMPDIPDLRAPRAVPDEEARFLGGTEGIGVPSGARRAERQRELAAFAEGDTEIQPRATDVQSAGPVARPRTGERGAMVIETGPVRSIDQLSDVRRRVDQAYQSLTPEESAALQHYRRSSYAGKKALDAERMGTASDYDPAALKSALAKLEVQNPTEVGPLYRGFDMSEGQFQNLVNKGKLQLSNVGSASYFFDKASEFASHAPQARRSGAGSLQGTGDVPVIVEFQGVKRGSPNFPTSGGRISNHEAEVILPAGGTYEVVGVEPRKLPTGLKHDPEIDGYVVKVKQTGEAPTGRDPVPSGESFDAFEGPGLDRLNSGDWIPEGDLEGLVGGRQQLDALLDPLYGHMDMRSVERPGGGYETQWKLDRPISKPSARKYAERGAVKLGENEGFGLGLASSPMGQVSLVGGGALAGAAADPENPVRGAVIGAGAGAGLTTAARRAAVKGARAGGPPSGGKPSPVGPEAPTPTPGNALRRSLDEASGLASMERVRRGVDPLTQAETGLMNPLRWGARQLIRADPAMRFMGGINPGSVAGRIAPDITREDAIKWLESTGQR